MWFEGIWSLSIWGYVAVTLVLTHITIAGVTIYLHRHQSHNALSLHPLVSHFFRFWLWLTTGMVTKEWVAIHRKHHAKCETPSDPHSPVQLGLAKVLFAGAWLYHREADNPETLEKYGQGTPDDWLERKIYTPLCLYGMVLMALINMLCFGWVGLIIFAVQMIWIPLWAAGVINGVGHHWGYRSFETDDASSNILPWGILIGGEELHNNHHAFASSAKMSRYWWEFDLGWLYIRLLAACRLAKIRRVAPKFRIAMDSAKIDIDTVRAVVRNRFRILRIYGRRVILPEFRSARMNAGKEARLLFKSARRLIIREDRQQDADAQQTIDLVLKQSRQLETVYQFKQRLKEIWLENQHGRVQRLQEWCAQAEATGIRALEDFSQYLKGYQLKTA